MRRTGRTLGLFCVTFGLFWLTTADRPAAAEVYVGGMAGYTAPNDFSDVNLTTLGTGVSDLSLQDSVVYGGKLGVYFPGIRWLGVETEVFRTTPHVKQQAVTAGGATLSVPGSHLSVLTWAFNAVVRYPGKRFQPYAGVGVGIFFAESSFQGRSEDDTVPGFNALAGLRFFLTDHLALFGEYKYTRATFEFPGLIGIKGDYSANQFVGGVGIHF